MYHKKVQLEHLLTPLDMGVETSTPLRDVSETLAVQAVRSDIKFPRLRADGQSAVTCCGAREWRSTF